MEQINEKQLLEMLNNGTITPYNLYNLDIEYTQFYSISNYLKNKNDTLEREQRLNILFLDIELFLNHTLKFPDISQAKFPINAITIYSTFEKIYRCYILLFNENIAKFPNDDLQKLKNDYMVYLKKEKYLDDDETIEIEVFGYEIDLIKKVWQTIHTIDPAVISGWNSDGFDIPYIYFRLSTLLKDDNEINKILSKFSNVKINKFGNSLFVKIADYSNADLQYLYKPRDEGGLNMGKKQPSYSLDWVSEDELGLKKLEYKKEGLTLDQLFLDDPVNFLLYNIMDVCLVVKLNKKLKHIQNHNMYRRLMKTSFDSSLKGSSILFDTFVLYKLQEQNKYIRFGINDETDINIIEHDINQLPKPTGKKNIKWITKSLDSKQIKQVSSTFPGAYVKASPGKVFNQEDGILIILDATALYPSMIRENNISFDSFFGRIIDPNVYKFLNAIEKNLGNERILSQFFNSILEVSIDHVEIKSPPNKNEAYQENYYITAYAIKKIITQCKDFNNLLKPQAYQDYVLLKNYFMLSIDMMERMHKNAEEYNSFCYEYLINNSKKLNPDDPLYIIENYNETSLKIKKIQIKDFYNYIIEKNLLVTLSGGLFYKHNNKIGLFSDWLKEMYILRKQYQKTRDTFSRHTDDYDFYDMLQKATKVAMNTSYGLYGLTSFRYSNHHLAKAITTEGRLRLKICQQISEILINQ